MPFYPVSLSTSTAMEEAAAIEPTIKPTIHLIRRVSRLARSALVAEPICEVVKPLIEAIQPGLDPTQPLFH